jgi:type IV secretory pathway TraG/TraD family ATPase VirD4
MVLINRNNFQLGVITTAISSVTSLILTYLFIKYTWSVFFDLGEFKVNQTWFLESIKNWIIGHNQSVSFLDYLTNNNLMEYVIGFVTIIFILNFVIISLIVFKWLHSKEKINNSLYMSGMKCISGNEAIRHANKLSKKEIVRTNSKKGLYVHPKICIPSRIETDNFLLAGKQGSGKSTILKSIVNQILNRSNLSVIYDAKGEYKEEFYTAYSKKIAVIDPTSSQYISWNISQDVGNESDAKLIAECLIVDGDNDEFWVGGARIILTGIFCILLNTKKTWDWKNIEILLNLPVSKLEQLFLDHYPKGEKLVKVGCKTSSSYFNVLMQQLNWLSIVADNWQSSPKSISVKKWINRETEFESLFIINNPSQTGMSVPICLAIFSLVDRHLRSLPDSSTREIWFVFDELANFPKNKGVINLLSMGRSKGARTAIGIQNINQIREIYGDKIAETLNSLFSVIFILKVGFSKETALKLAENIGTQEVYTPSITFDPNGRKSVTYSKETRLAIEPDTIMNLPFTDGKTIAGFLFINGWEVVYRLDWPMFSIRVNDYKPLNPNKMKVPDEPTQTIKKKSRGSRGRKFHANS